MRNDSAFIVGLDLGQAHDPSALAVLQRSDVVTVEGQRKTTVAHYACPWLQRWPLGTSYVTVCQDVVVLLNKPPLVGCDLVIDASGCGRPVFDLFKDKIKERKLSARLHGVVITAGLGESFTDGFYHVAKVILISTAQVVLQQRRLQFAASLPEVPTLVKELQDYRVKITPAANETWSAREGANDDLLLACAVALWRFEKCPPVTSNAAPFTVDVCPNLGGYAHGSPGVLRGLSGQTEDRRQRHAEWNRP